MQPPLIFENLRKTVDRLKTEALSANAVRVQPLKTANIADEYTQRIRAWVGRLPPVQRCRAFTISEVIALVPLPGHFRPNASLRYTGEALQRCGFKQKRDWTVAGRNRRYWYLVGDTK